MSILIKGMEMPKGCWYCPMIKVHHITGKQYCGKSLKGISDNFVRLPDCPLVEVPTPHGRLIDADEYGANYIIDFDKSPLEVLESTPTIIEAEVSEI